VKFLKVSIKWRIELDKKCNTYYNTYHKGKMRVIICIKRDGISMGCEQMMQKLSFILRGEYLKKAMILQNEEGTMIVRIDLHGMTRDEAIKAIKGVLLLNREHFIFDLVHGYNRGTALKSVIINDLNSTRIIRKWGNAYNPGETFLEIAGAY